MRKANVVLLAAATFVVGGMASDASAESPWHAFGGVRIGGIHFSVGFDAERSGRYDRYERPYYRTSHRLHYRGRECGSFCFRRRGDYYHHESCPVLGAHFSRYDYGPQYRRDRSRGEDRYFYRDHEFERDYRYERRRHRHPGQRGRRGRW